MSLRHLRTEFFRLKMDFQKKKSNMSDKTLSNRVKLSKKIFNAIKNEIQQAKRNNLQARPQHGSPINFDESYKLIQEIVHGNITHEEASNKMAGIRKNIKRLAI